MMYMCFCVYFTGFTVDDGLTLHDVGLYIESKGLTIQQDGSKITGGLTIYDKGFIDLFPW